MSVVIRLEQLSKAFRLGRIDRRVFFRDWARRLRGDAAEIADDDPQLFWALRDVSCDILDGEVIGLLGRNGAGKSTLLKILSQITAPTRGAVKIRGRVASLLEVGTGFHPELTGRDNVFLNGTILGMTRREVARKFDEIIAFSGIEEFIDTPVKRYSVGMRVRLAFAVAAHLDPEIMLIDEVLAVGDAAFQQRCLGKIGEVSRSGRTVIFVSHNTASIESLCTRGLVLDHGRLTFDGPTAEAVEHYGATRSASAGDLRARTDRTGSGRLRIVGLELRDAAGCPVALARAGEDLEVALHYEHDGSQSFPRLAAQLLVTTHVGAPVFSHHNTLSGDAFGELPPRGTLVLRLPRLPLPVGHFQLGFRIMSEFRGKDVLDAIDVAADLPVESGDFYGTGKLPQLRHGVALVQGTWRLDPAR